MRTGILAIQLASCDRVLIRSTRTNSSTAGNRGGSSSKAGLSPAVNLSNKILPDTKESLNTYLFVYGALAADVFTFFIIVMVINK